MKNNTLYSVTTIERGIVRKYNPKTWRKAKKYILKGAESIFREKTNKKGWYCELVWSSYE